MPHLKVSTLTLLACLWSATRARAEAPIPPLASPDGRLAIILEIADQDGVPGSLTYRITRDGETIVRSSRLDLLVKRGEREQMSLFRDLTAVAVRTSSHDATWNPVYGERATVRDHYNLLRVQLKAAEPVGVQLELELRTI